MMTATPITSSEARAFADVDYDVAKLFDLVPSHLQAGVRRYIEHGVKPGDAICAVLINDLKNAVFRLDEQALPGLKGFVQFLYNYAPAACWGSPANVAAWIQRGGINGAPNVH